MPRVRRLLGVLGAAPPASGDLPPRIRPEACSGAASSPALRPRASPQAPPTPVEELARARGESEKCPGAPRNGQGAATRCIRSVGPGRPEGWLQWAELFEALLIKIQGGRNPMLTT